MRRLLIRSLANGGEGVATDDDGRVVFVAGALPGERVSASITEQRARFARAELVEVLAPSPDRAPPSCHSHERGCGGCDLRHLRAEAQPHAKALMVRDALGRIGGLAEVDVVVGLPGPDDGYRTTVRCAVTDGRAGYRRRRGHDVVVADDCPVAHPLVQELIVHGRFDACTEVTLRCGARTGERLVVASPTAEGVSVPGDVRVVGDDELRAGRRAWIHEEVEGRVLRVSARSFFQSGPVAAELLVDAVRRALAPAGSPGDVPADQRRGEGALVDLFAGVGLFSATVLADLAAQGNHPIVAVERSRAAVADARVNLAPLRARVVGAAVESWRPPRRTAVVVADPARSGLGAPATAVVASTGAPVVVLISCDAAALGRDAGLLARTGYRLVRSEVVDCFAQTSHVEVVSRFERGGER